ncbi:hypothetical protein BYT27DRAFT_6377975 [Phlegmacium glaucopus]|nr:hypothetical protein BYT27DRAFT_6377975 [Phlegmacium glaucopus]
MRLSTPSVSEVQRWVARSLVKNPALVVRMSVDISVLISAVCWSCRQMLIANNGQHRHRLRDIQERTHSSNSIDTLFQKVFGSRVTFRQASPWEWQTVVTGHCDDALLIETIIIMSNERPSKNNRVARSFKKHLSSLFHSKRPPTPSPIEVGSSFGNHMAAVDAGTSNLPLEMASPDCALATAVASTEASTMSSPIFVPISASGPAVPRQLDSASRQGPEIPLMVSVYAALAIFATNYCSCSTRLQAPIVQCLSSKALTMYTCTSRQLTWPTVSSMCPKLMEMNHRFLES